MCGKSQEYKQKHTVNLVFSSSSGLLWQQQLPDEPADDIAGRPARVGHQQRRKPAPVPVNVLRSPRSAEPSERPGKENHGRLLQRNRTWNRSVPGHGSIHSVLPEDFSFVSNVSCWLHRSFPLAVRFCSLHVRTSLQLAGRHDVSAAWDHVLRGTRPGVLAAPHQHCVHGGRRSSVTQNNQSRTRSLSFP